MAAPVITATIAGRDELSPLLEKIALRALSIAETFKAIGSPLAEVNGALRSMIRHAELMERAVTAAFDNGKLGRFTASLGQASTSMDRIGSAADRANNRLSAMEGHAARVKRELGAMQQVAANVAGILPLVMGGGIAHAGVRMVENSAEYEQQKNRVFTAKRDNQAEVDRADRLAGSIAGKHPLVTKTQAIEDYVELRSLAADDHGGVNGDQLDRNTRVMARARQALAAMGQTLSPHEARSLATAVEGSGRAGDPRAQEKIVDAYIRAKGVFGTAIDADKIRDFVANAKAANFPMGDDAFYYTVMARLAQGNASRLGNEHSSSYQTLVGGKMTKQGAQWLVDTGQITQDQIVDGKGGKFYIRGDIKNKDQLASDMTGWAQDVLLPGLEKKGVISDANVAKRMDTLRAAELKANPNAKVDEHALKERALHGLIADDLAKAGFKTTVSDNLIHAIANEALIKKDVAQMKAHYGIDAADTIARNPVAAFHELTNAIANLGIVLGTPAMQGAAGFLDSLANGLASFTEKIAALQEEHPTLAKGAAVAIPATLAGGGLAAVWGVLSGLFGRGDLKGSALALTGSAAALDGAAAALTAAAEVQGVGKVASAAAGAAGGAAAGTGGAVATGAAIGAVGTGAAPAVVVGGATLLGLGTMAAVAMSELNRLAEAGGKRSWSVSRVWSMLTTGQDEPVSKAEVDAEVERRIEARKRGEAKDLPTPNGRSSFLLDPKFWFGDGNSPGIVTGKYALPGTPGAWSPSELEALEARRKIKDDDLAPDASRTFTKWGVKVGTGSPQPIENLRELRITNDQKVEVTGQGEIYANVKIDASGFGDLKQKVSIPLNTGSQGAGPGSTFFDSSHYRRDRS